MRPEVMKAERFVAHVMQRMSDERPDLVVKHLHGFFLVVEYQGRQRVVSLANVYQNYTQVPEDLDPEVTNFLASIVYEEPPGIRGGLPANYDNILPQVVPQALVDFCRRDGKGLPVIPFTGGLYIAFVVDEPQRYCYVNDVIMQRWDVTEEELLVIALENLKAQTDMAQLMQIGVGDTAMYLYESFDGYDASRILLGGMILQLMTKVAGDLLVAIPNRDFFVAFGNTNPSFVAQMRQQIEEQYAGHSYAICPDLLRYEDGTWTVYGENPNEIRVLN